MEQILMATTVVAAVVLATTSMVKSLVPNNKLLPIINVGVGVSIGLVYAVTIEPGQLAVYGWAGFISGLGAGGFYDLSMNVKGFYNQNKATKLINSGKGYQDLDDSKAYEKVGD